MSAIYRMVKYATTPHNERDTAKTAAFTSGFYGHFPTSLGMYFVGAGTDYKSQRFYLGNEDVGRLYALTFHEGYGGFRQMTLYAGSEHNPPLLAMASNEKRYSTSANIVIPGSADGGSESWTERLKSQRNAHCFTAVIGQGDEARIEKFEWRDDKKPKPKVRRLTRTSEEGLEVVAVWKEGSVPNRQGRLATLEFFESGATGELGEVWMLMAVVSALRVCQSQWVALAGSQIQSHEKYISWHADETGDKKTSTEPFWSYGPASQAKMTE